MADGQQSPGLLANILAVAGFIILIVIIVWGAYHLLRLTGSGVSSLFSRFTNRGGDITLTIPESVQSGKAFPIQWKHVPTENGAYTFIYQCKSGFKFELPNSSGQPTALPCGNAFIIGTSTALTLRPILVGSSAVEIPVSVVFMPAATSSSARPQGAGTVRVIAAAANETANMGTSGTTGTTGTGSVGETPSTGPADLYVQVLSIGVIDPVTGMFVQRAPMHSNDIAAVRFNIGNRGGRATGEWYFSVQLPTYPANLYQSPAQASLTPDSYVENTLRFRPVNPGGGYVTISVDQTNAVSESNESNNVTSQWVSAYGGYSF